jgi:hypothetical protein
MKQGAVLVARPFVIDAARCDLGFSPATSIADDAAATRDWVIERGTS